MGFGLAYAVYFCQFLFRSSHCFFNTCKIIKHPIRQHGAYTGQSLEYVKLEGANTSRQKLELVRKLGAGSTIAIGNGANDAEMLKGAAIWIAVIGREGASAKALQAADVVVKDIGDALNCLLNPQRLVATLRG